MVKRPRESDQLARHLVPYLYSVGVHTGREALDGPPKIFVLSIRGYCPQAGGLLAVLELLRLVTLQVATGCVHVHIKLREAFCTFLARTELVYTSVRLSLKFPK